MEQREKVSTIKTILDNMPSDWLNLTTHRLDIYNEVLAKSEFLTKLNALVRSDEITEESLSQLPTAYDYIRLGHPLSSILEWIIAEDLTIKAEQVISFDSKSIPLMAILRKNMLSGNKTRIICSTDLPACFKINSLKSVYGYDFEIIQSADISILPSFDGASVLINETNDICDFTLNNEIDFTININELGSIVVIDDQEIERSISEIQHVRRRETIAMTPSNTLIALKNIEGIETVENFDTPVNKLKVQNEIASITKSKSKSVVASSGLSMQYAIAMGLIDFANENHSGKSIKFIVPTNCYGGTNDQARRIAACLKHVDVVDLSVDGGNDMVSSIDKVLEEVASEDAVPFIIAEIPTNPRVEVPHIEALRDALIKKRTTKSGSEAIEPVFVLDQTFCPNTQFLGDDEILSTTQTLAYVSGSKFPSGGKCTAGYCVANKRASHLMDKIEFHLNLCDNEATDLQYQLLAEQLPSMLQRIESAYVNTREFVNFISKVLPDAKINFVSEELASQGFTPSVFSLDLPTKGNTNEERESYKRELNLRLINMMIGQIPNESKYCVSYGQLKGCYWTIPATSTQGTTKEGDKDYIARVSLSGNMDLEKHKLVFQEFVNSL